MKKFLVGLLTVALAASMLVGCGKKEEKTKTDNSLKDVQSKKELVLGLDSSFPPMGFTDNKENGNQIKITANQLEFQRTGT